MPDACAAFVAKAAPWCGYGAREGQAVVYGTRPEQIDLVQGTDGIGTEVVVVEPTGAETQIFTRIGGIEVTRSLSDFGSIGCKSAAAVHFSLSMPKARQAPNIFREHHDFRPGAQIRLRPDPTRRPPI